MTNSADLPNCLRSTKASMFADDTNISCDEKLATDIQQKINSDLNSVHNWLLANKLTLSAEKTEYMIVGSRQRLNQINSDPDILIGYHMIKRVSNKKFLGVQCRNCGRIFPHTGDCPAKLKECRACGKTGHFAKVCRSKPKRQEIRQVVQTSTKEEPHYIFTVQLPLQQHNSKSYDLIRIQERNEERFHTPKPITSSQTNHWSDPEIQLYTNVKDELSVCDGLIIRGTRLVLPKSLHHQAIELAHTGHQGIVKTKRLLREKVWFLLIDRMVQGRIKHCIPCQAATQDTMPKPEAIEYDPT
ncbi:115 kDa [Paramuricea clavata]|uniref:115 kDa n=2 Tax=Paramuricea clavata TaxID=317549 RepID=A0A6S7IC90_PARCT|nr:115 kDa [Paramuricea clavata]